MNRLFGVVFLFIYISFFTVNNNAYAFDESDNMKIISKKANWFVIEYAAATQLIYRIGSDAANQSGMHIVFDFAVSQKCEPRPAELIVDFGKYLESLDGGKLLMQYKLPGQKQSIELIDTVMKKNDTYAFLSFQHLTAKKLLMSKDKGKLAVWVLPSGDGRVQRSNIYFSLDGFTSAYKEAKKICNENR